MSRTKSGSKKYQELMSMFKDQQRAVIMFSKKSRGFLRVWNERCCKRSCRSWVVNGFKGMEIYFMGARSNGGIGIEDIC